jgi:hypothetical protein
MVFVLLGGNLAARAQETTFPVTPDPSECTVTPLTSDELYAVIGTPVSGTPMAGTDGETNGPEASPMAFTLPTGTPADEATRAAVTSTLRMVLACFNAGNYLAYLALSTDASMQADFGETPLTEEDAAFLVGTPQASDPSMWATLVAVRDVILLDDGRVGALVDTIFPDEEPGVQTDFIYFANEDGTWKFDDIVEDLEGQYPPEAMGTPAAA